MKKPILLIIMTMFMIGESVYASPFNIDIGSSLFLDEGWNIKIRSEETSSGGSSTTSDGIWYNDSKFVKINTTNAPNSIMVQNEGNITMMNSSIYFNKMIYGRPMNFTLGFQDEKTAIPGWGYELCLGTNNRTKIDRPMMCIRNDTGTINFYIKENYLNKVYFNDLVSIDGLGQIAGARNYTTGGFGAITFKYETDPFWWLELAPETAQDVGLLFDTPLLKWEWNVLGRATQNLTIDLADSGTDTTEMVNAKAYGSYFTQNGEYKINYHGGGTWDWMTLGGDLEASTTGWVFDEDAIVLKYYTLGTEVFNIDQLGNMNLLGNVFAIIGNYTIVNTNNINNTANINTTNLFVHNYTRTRNLNATGNITGNNFYGQIWNKSDAGFCTVDLTVADAYEPIKNLTGGLMNGFTNDTQNLTVAITGVYSIDASVSMGAGGNGEFGVKIFVNEVAHPECYAHNHLSAGNEATFPINCPLSLNAGDKVSIRVDDHTGTPNDPTIKYAGLFIEGRIGN